MSYRCENCGSPEPGRHYQAMCPGDLTLRRLPTASELAEAIAEIDKSGPTLDVAFWRLADEKEPDGMVVGVNKHGQETVWMPREDWEQIRASLTAQTCGGCGLKCLDAHGQCRACGARKGQSREPWVERVKR